MLLAYQSANCSISFSVYFPIVYLDFDLIFFEKSSSGIPTGIRTWYHMQLRLYLTILIHLGGFFFLVIVYLYFDCYHFRP